MPYARGTTVEVSKTKMEIEKLVTQYGATAFMAGTSSTQRMSQVGFELRSRRIMFRVNAPDAQKFGTGERYAAEDRRRWRCLLLSIKAKLECVATGIETFDEAFLAHIVMPDGSTVGQTALPRIAEAYKTGKMQPLLPERSSAS